MKQANCLKRLDAVFGVILCRLLRRTSRPNKNNAVRRALLIRPGGIGDAVLLAPALAALKQKFPDAIITVLAEKRNAGVFALIPGVAQVLRYDVPNEFLASFRLKPDITIDTEQYHRLSAVVARLAGAATLIGYGTNERARLFHHAIPYSHDDYEADSFFHLLAPLGITLPASVDAPFLTVPAGAHIRAKQLLAPLADRPFIALFPGASIPERRWETKRFSRIAVRLAAQGYEIVVIGGREDAATGSAISNVGGLNLAGQTSLAETAAILNRSTLLISADSGVLHLGVGLGIPTVSLFGPGIAQKWAPRGPRHLVLNRQLACSPCTKFGYTPKCRGNAECLKGITQDEVFQAAMRLLPK